MESNSTPPVKGSFREEVSKKVESKMVWQVKQPVAIEESKGESAAGQIVSAHQIINKNNPKCLD